MLVDDGGSGGIPVIFVHSLAGNTQQWTAQLTHVRKSWRAVAFDLRGHGQSLRVAGGSYGIDALAEDVHAVVNELGFPRFILVGHSLGGSVAVAYEGTYPDRIAGLLLVDPSGDSTQIPDAEIQQFIGAVKSV